MVCSSFFISMTPKGRGIWHDDWKSFRTNAMVKVGWSIHLASGHQSICIYPGLKVDIENNENHRWDLHTVAKTMAFLHLFLGFQGSIRLSHRLSPDFSMGFKLLVVARHQGNLSGSSCRCGFRSHLGLTRRRRWPSASCPCRTFPSNSSTPVPRSHSLNSETTTTTLTHGFRGKTGRS